MTVTKSPELIEAEREALHDCVQYFINRMKDPAEQARLSRMRRKFNKEHGGTIQRMIDNMEEKQIAKHEEL